MLRLQGNDGWWLVTHPDHAHLAGEFAAAWGNDLFAAPEPREHVLRGIYAHDNGWAARDARPVVMRSGKPAAFSVELVGSYSAFEEIDLEAYLAVRRSAVQLIAQEDAYAAILISMHTYNLLTDRADRSTIRAEQLPLLDEFLAEQLELQGTLRERLVEEGKPADGFVENFRLLQACDNLSLLSCVDFGGDATLLWPQQLRDSGAQEIAVSRVGERSFKLTPYPFADAEMVFKLLARFVPGLVFESDEALRAGFEAAKVEEVEVRVLA